MLDPAALSVAMCKFCAAPIVWSRGAKSGNLFSVDVATAPTVALPLWSRYVLRGSPDGDLPLAEKLTANDYISQVAVPHTFTCPVGKGKWVCEEVEERRRSNNRYMKHLVEVFDSRAITSAVGRSKITNVKQRHLSSIIGYLLTSVVAQSFHFVDLTCGPGFNVLADGSFVRGSPNVFLNLARLHRVPFGAVLSDLEPACVQSLRDTLLGQYPREAPSWFESGAVKIRQGDHREVIEMIKSLRGLYPASYWLVYWDSNGGEYPFEELSELQRCGVDVLMHVTATSIKRVNEFSPGKLPSLREGVNQLGAGRQVFVREPSGDGWQWTFLLFTQHPFPFMNLRKSFGFHPVNSAYGERILDRLQHTKAVLKMKEKGVG